MGALQPMHLIIVLAIVLLIFGPGKLPELGRAIGDGMRELKRTSNNDTGAAPTTLAPISLSASTCASCRSRLPTSASFCGNCGVATNIVPATTAAGLPTGFH